MGRLWVIAWETEMLKLVQSSKTWFDYQRLGRVSEIKYKYSKCFMYSTSDITISVGVWNGSLETHPKLMPSTITKIMVFNFLCDRLRISAVIQTSVLSKKLLFFKYLICLLRLNIFFLNIRYEEGTNVKFIFIIHNSQEICFFFFGVQKLKDTIPALGPNYRLPPE